MKRWISFLALACLALAGCSGPGSSEPPDAASLGLEVPLDGTWRLGGNLLSHTYYIFSYDRKGGTLAVESFGTVIHEHRFEVMGPSCFVRHDPRSRRSATR